MPIGTVLRYERNSGFGFIRSESGQEIYVHHTALSDREYLVAGQEVRFKIDETGERGPRAMGVTVTRDVSVKHHRQLDWRGRQRPRSGELPLSARPPGEELDAAEEETAHETSP